MKLLILLTVVFGVSSAVAQSLMPSRHDRDLITAEQTLIRTILDSVSSSNKADQFKAPAADLALAFLAAGDDPSSARAFASLLAYRLDGAVGEDFECYALAKHPAFNAELNQLKPSVAVSSCESRVKTASAAMGTDAARASFSLCRSVAETRSAVDELRRARAAKKKCDTEDF